MVNTNEPDGVPARGPSVMEKAAYLDVTYSEERAPYGPYPGQLAAWIAENHFPKQGRLLDIGCGRGEYLSAFSRLGFEVCGTDISPGAPGLSPDFEVRVANLDSAPIPYEKDSFDIVFSKSVIEHTHTPQVMLQKAFEVLRPGGIAVIMTPSWTHTYWGPFYCDHTHVSPFTAYSLGDILTLTGFGVEGVEYVTQLPFIWRHPYLKPLTWLVRNLPIPYRPYKRAPWPNGVNKFVQFSNELMLLAVAKKPIPKEANNA